MGYSPWGGKESARTEHTHTHTQAVSVLKNMGLSIHYLLDLRRVLTPWA